MEGAGLVLVGYLAWVLAWGGVGTAWAKIVLEPPEAGAEARELERAPELGVFPLEGEIDRATYILGPGDRLVLWLSGERVRVLEMEVTPEGVVLLDPAGPVRVSGLTLSDAERVILDALSPFYRNVTMRAHLAGIREFQVHVLGEVQFPGVYIASPVQRVAGVIARAGGVTPIGSRRNITIVRRNGEVLPVDLVAYEVLGRLGRNPLLMEGDVVHVPAVEASVRLLGSVFRPGEIELRVGERVGDLITLAGGLEPSADLSRVEIERFAAEDPSQTERVFLNLEGFGTREVRDSGLPLMDGDRIYLRSVPKWHEENAVLVQGEVRYPGWYAIEKDREHLSDIIRRAGGFSPLAGLREGTVVRAERDTVVDREFLRLKNMPVVDMTKTEYEYFKFRSRERRGQMVADFGKLFLENDMSHDLVLRNRDVINVPRKPLTVGVEGQVASPGHVIFAAGQGIDYYVAQAGGYSWNANTGKVRVIKVRSGEWKWPKQVKSLEPGDTIWVPEKREIEWWKLLTEVSRVLAELATVYLIVDRALADE